MKVRNLLVWIFPYTGIANSTLRTLESKTVPLRIVCVGSITASRHHNLAVYIIILYNYAISHRRYLSSSMWSHSTLPHISFINWVCVIWSSSSRMVACTQDWTDDSHEIIATMLLFVGIVICKQGEEVTEATNISYCMCFPIHLPCHMIVRQKDLIYIQYPILSQLHTE